MTSTWLSMIIRDFDKILYRKRQTIGEFRAEEYSLSLKELFKIQGGKYPIGGKKWSAVKEKRVGRTHLGWDTVAMKTAGNS